MLPVAMVFTQQLLLTAKSAATPQSGKPEQEAEQMVARATRVTSVLRDIPGYDHSGLNE